MAANNNNYQARRSVDSREEYKGQQYLGGMSVSARVNNPQSPAPIKHRNDTVEDIDNNNNNKTAAVRSQRPAPSRGDEIEGRNSIAMMHPGEQISGDKSIDTVLRFATENGYVLEIEQESRGGTD